MAFRKVIVLSLFFLLLLLFALDGQATISNLDFDVFLIEPRQVCSELVCLLTLGNIHRWSRRHSHALKWLDIKESAGWKSPSDKIIEESINLPMQTCEG